MKVDVRPTRADIRRWQQKYETMPPEISQAMQRCFVGEETDDFYIGLMAGLGVASMLHLKGMGDTTVQLTAVVADLCDRKELA